MTTALGSGYAKAKITEWNLGAPNATGSAVDGGVSLCADFDPHSLQLRYAVTAPNAGQQTQSSGVQRNKAPAQWTTAAATLSMTLVFDSTADGRSVQEKTSKLVLLTKAAAAPSASKPFAAKVIKFEWGSFHFYGSVTSLSQTLEYFSAQGTPLRATVELSLQQVEKPPPEPNASSGTAPRVALGAGKGTASAAGSTAAAGPPPAPAAVGTTPLTLSASGDTVQGIAAQAGTSVSWKVVAAANNIDNPRLLAPGTVLDLSGGAPASLVAGASASVQVQTS